MINLIPLTAMATHGIFPDASGDRDGARRLRLNDVEGGMTGAHQHLGKIENVSAIPSFLIFCLAFISHRRVFGSLRACGLRPVRVVHLRCNATAPNLPP